MTDTASKGVSMQSWVQVSHDGEHFICDTYLECVKVCSIECTDPAIVLYELKTKMDLIRGLARGKIFTSTIGR